MQAIDRPVAALGGKDLVEGRPGIGWLVFEVTPAFIWTQITGAMSMEFYYFVAYLTLLGATDTTLAWLPMMVSLGGVGQTVVVLLRRPSDPKRACVIDCLLGRCAWSGTLLWPIFGWWAGFGANAIIAGVFVSVFLTQLIASVSVASFIVWTQALVPRELRGVFYAWRQLSSYVVVALVLLGVYWYTHRFLSHSPAGLGHEPADLPYLMLMLGAATLVGIIGVWPLALAPGMPPADRVVEYRPMLPQLTANAALLRHVGWMVVTSVGVNLSSAYIPKLYLQAGVAAETMAWWQAFAMYPAMLVGIVATGWALPRVHARRTLVFAHVITIAAELCLLRLQHAGIGWMLPAVLVLFGVAKGIWSIAWIARLQEIVPRGDPRFAAVFMGLASLAALLVSTALPAAVSALDAYCASHPGVPPVAWWMVAAGIAARILATPMLVWPERVQATGAYTRPA